MKSKTSKISELLIIKISELLIIITWLIHLSVSFHWSSGYLIAIASQVDNAFLPHLSMCVPSKTINFAK